jgi:hypothetical protein
MSEFEVQPRDNPGYVRSERKWLRSYEAKTLGFSAPFGAIIGFGTQGRQVRRTKLLMRLNLLKGNTEKEWCKTGKKQTVEDRVMSFDWGSCT